MIDVNDLHVSAEKKEILRGLNLQIKLGEIHAIMGPNGSGKSTLANVIAGNQDYEVKSGKIEFTNLRIDEYTNFKKKTRRQGKDWKNLLEMNADERARQGIFLSFQNPPVITGVQVGNFLRQIYLVQSSKFKVQSSKPMSLGDFRIWVLDLMKRLSLKPEIFNSTLNETMSGGEKKKLEILQMIILKPRLIILDEIDSGLDVDALKIICSEINRYAKENPDSSFLIISHYNRIFSYIKPDFVHIMKSGKIVLDGDSSLVESIEKMGYVNL
jgi:Fe-S cluster assembly ATP-binding protein